MDSLEIPVMAPEPCTCGPGNGINTLRFEPRRCISCGAVSNTSLSGEARDAITGGGRLLVVQTNNATYGRTGQPDQQLAITRLRAIEHGRTTLVAATSGVSAIIKPKARLDTKNSGTKIALGFTPPL